jgi:hypothetical protein
MTEERKYAILFVATLLCARKLIQTGSEAGVNGTPTFFINGEFLSGVKSDADFTQIIDRQLAALSGKVSTQAASR